LIETSFVADRRDPYEEIYCFISSLKNKISDKDTETRKDELIDSMKLCASSMMRMLFLISIDNAFRVASVMIEVYGTIMTSASAAAFLDAKYGQPGLISDRPLLQISSRSKTLVDIMALRLSVVL
jgi:hypothetical protein